MRPFRLRRFCIPSKCSFSIVKSLVKSETPSRITLSHFFENAFRALDRLLIKPFGTLT